MEEKKTGQEMKKGKGQRGEKTKDGGTQGKKERKKVSGEKEIAEKQ